MKKIIALTLIAVVGIFAMVGCAKSGSGEDPIELAMELDNCGYYVEVVADHEYIVETAIYLGLDFEGVEAYVQASVGGANGSAGVFVFCESENVASDVEAQLVKFSTSPEFRESFVNGAVERKGTLVFFGSEEYLSFVE